MDATTVGDNRTGAAVAPKDVELMLAAVRELSPPIPISTLQMDVERQSYIADADSVGSIPPTKKSAKKGARKRGVTTPAMRLSLLLDKLGERIAFERTGTRLYAALITKYLALEDAGADPLPTLVAETDDQSSVSEADELAESEEPVETLHRIRSEELAHFRMLTNCVQELGGDPTAETPCADVTAAQSLGFMQVLTDPRTTFAQCLNTMLSAELTDSAGWELLAELAERAGQTQLVEPFTEALEAEQRHVAVIRGWLRSLLANAESTPAV